MKLITQIIIPLYIFSISDLILPEAASCKTDEDCLKKTLRCCDGVCIDTNNECRVACQMDSQCKTNVGEKCVANLCRCKDGRCLNTNVLATVSPTSSGSTHCVNSSECAAEKLCENGICTYAKPRMSPGVIAAVTIGCCLVFVAAFYFCLRGTHSERPSVRAREKVHKERLRARSADAVFKETSGSHEKLTAPSANINILHVPTIMVTAPD